MNKYKVTVRFNDDQPSIIVHFNSPKLDAIGIAPGISDTYINPIEQAHQFAQAITTTGSSIRLDNGVMYIPVHRVRDAVVEKMP